MRKHPVDEHYPKLVAYLEKILNRRDLAEDAAQEAYLRAYRAADGKPIERAALFAFGENIAIDMLRREEVRARPPREDVPLLDATRVFGSTLECLVESEPREKLEELISELPPSLQEPVRLRFQQGMSCKSAARMLRITVGALEQRLTRAIALLRKRMDALFGNPPS